MNMRGLITWNTWKKGFLSGIRTSWILGKIIFPVTFIVAVLQYTPVIDWLVALFDPLMVLFGLPGEASIVLALGNLLNLYAAIGAILSLDLTVKEVFILAVMLSFSHNLLVETAVANQIGVKGWVLVLVRLGLAFFSAAAINLGWGGGAEKAVYGIIGGSGGMESGVAVSGWGNILWHAVETASVGIIQLVVIVFPLMLGIQILKDLHALQYLAKGMSPFTRLLGVSANSAVTLMAGLMFGLAYGAGVIIQSAKEENIPKRDLYLLIFFLAGCHAVVEDTLIFVPLGINVLPLLLIRLVVAMILTISVARIWKERGIDSSRFLQESSNHGGHVCMDGSHGHGMKRGEHR